MATRKFTTPQERAQHIKNFLASGKSQLVWCEENDIKNSTFGKWLRDYKSEQNEVKFIPLTAAPEGNQLHADKTQEIRIEIGSCRFHVPEQLGIPFLMQAMKAVSESDVSIQ